MAARGTLLLRTIVRRFELGRSLPPRTVTTHPTLQDHPTMYHCVGDPFPAPLFRVDRLFFFLRVRVADSFHEGAGHKNRGRAKRIQGAGNGAGFVLSTHMYARSGEGRRDGVRICKLLQFVLSNFGLFEDPLLSRWFLDCWIWLIWKYLLVFIVSTMQFLFRSNNKLLM